MHGHGSHLGFEEGGTHGSNEGLSGNNQSNEELVNSEDLVVHSLRKESRRRYKRKEKGKMKMLGYGTDKVESDRTESSTARNEDGPSETRSESAKRGRLKIGKLEVMLIHPPEAPRDAVWI